MGVDAMIYVECEDPIEDLCLPEYYHLKEREGDLRRVYSPHRYYRPGYERGPWPQICAALMELFASPSVSRVWYFGDDDWIEDRLDRPTTIDDVLEISRHYMQYGNRPYDDYFQRGRPCSR